MAMFRTSHSTQHGTVTAMPLHHLIHYAPHEGRHVRLVTPISRKEAILVQMLLLLDGRACDLRPKNQLVHNLPDTERQFQDKASKRGWGMEALIPLSPGADGGNFHKDSRAILRCP